jgi:hypothetical protein
MHAERRRELAALGNHVGSAKIFRRADKKNIEVITKSKASFFCSSHHSSLTLSPSLAWQ